MKSIDNENANEQVANKRLSGLQLLSKGEVKLKIRLFVAVILTFFLASCASMGSGNRTQKQDAILKMKDDVLTQLFHDKPNTRSQSGK